VTATLHERLTWSTVSGDRRTSPPDYVRFVAPDWREQPDTRRLIGDLSTIVAETGAELVASGFGSNGGQERRSPSPPAD
jgi:hypothetical protein